MRFAAAQTWASDRSFRRQSMGAERLLAPTGSFLARSWTGSPGQKQPTAGGGFCAGCRLSRRKNLGGPSMEVFFALVACPDDEDQLRSADVEAQHVPC
jgi:hypothetical protein